LFITLHGPMMYDLMMLTFALAALCAACMGYAIQRGGTCTVAAVTEVTSQRTFGRLGSLLEASLWVGGGLLIAASVGVIPRVPAGYATSGWTVGGGVLLGLGAWLNGACVMGTIARLGSGEWAYVLTPAGFYLGCVIVGALERPGAVALAEPSPVIAARAWVVWPVVAFAAWRLTVGVRGLLASIDVAHPRKGFAAHAARMWSPHAATLAIGVTFLAMLLLVGAWAYTEVLAELAHGMAMGIAARLGLFAALLAGSLVAGWSAGCWRHVPPTAAQVARCVIGGALMGCGSLLIPGGNDGLVLVGMPLLWPYAWLAFAVTCATIAAAQLAVLRGTSLKHRPHAAR
jgi:toxin CptA